MTDKELTAVAEILYNEFYGVPPCDINDNGEFMNMNCEDYCEEQCGKVRAKQCWGMWLKTKLKEKDIEVDDE